MLLQICVKNFGETRRRNYEELQQSLFHAITPVKEQKRTIKGIQMTFTVSQIFLSYVIAL